MSIKKLNPYLHFNGTAEQAIKLYESALGARTADLMRYGDVAEMKIADEHKSRIMHSLLRIGDAEFMVGDAWPGRPFVSEGNVEVCLHFDDPADMAKKFEALAEGGKITMPLDDTFWGARFGALTDAHGIQWMFNCDLKKG